MPRTPMNNEEKKCERDEKEYLSNPPQFKCKNCGQFWFVKNEVPNCKNVEINTIFTPSSKEGDSTEDLAEMAKKYNIHDKPVVTGYAGKLTHMNDIPMEDILDSKEGEWEGWIKERTAAISEMFDNVDEVGIYPTSKLFNRLDAFINTHFIPKQSLIEKVEESKYVFDRPKDDYLPEVYKHLKSKNEAKDDIISLLKGEIKEN